MTRAQEQKQIRTLLKKYSREVEKAFLAALQEAADGFSLSSLIAALEAGDIEGAINLFTFTQGQLFPLDDAIRSAYVASGQSVAVIAPRLPYGRFAFDGRHARAEAFLQQQAAANVATYNEAAKDSARRIITEGFERNDGVKKIARNLAGKMVGNKRVDSVFGLSGPYAEALENSMNQLASNDPGQLNRYLDRKLRDKRFDPIVKKALRDGTPLSAKQLQNIRDSTTAKLIRRRAKEIAQNEAFTAQSMGRHEGYRQLMEREDVELVTKRWQHNLSDPAREDHEAMNGTTIPVDQDFQFSDATMSAPHDPRGGPKHSMYCRCTAIYRVVKRRGLR